MESYPEFAFVKGYSVGFDAHEYLWEQGFHNGGGFLEQNLVDITGAVRRSVHQAVGGYDETIRDGLEDWDFWLHCASQGHWGTTLPEYLDWYRRRENHGERWDNWDGGKREADVSETTASALSASLGMIFPPPRPHRSRRMKPSPTRSRGRIRLHKEKPRLLLIAPWLTMGGSDKFNLDLLGQLVRRGWEVTIVTTLSGEHPWLSPVCPIYARYFYLVPFSSPRGLSALCALSDPKPGDGCGAHLE